MKRLVIAVGLMIIGLVGWWQVGQGVEVTRIVDGDTIELVDGRMIRYINVDTPEAGECFREESTKINTELVLGKKVKVVLGNDNMDDFGRYLAYVYVGRVMVNEELLKVGAGRFKVDFNNRRLEEELIKTAETSREQGVGLWSQCGGETGCVIKGNLDKDDVRWYHLSGFRHYDQVVMRLDLGDRWFCSQEEAIKAGFKKARE